MNSFERFAKTEHTIRKWLSNLADLEVEYMQARTEEIAVGAYKSKPFLRSRAIDRQIKTVLKKIRAIESSHNRYAAAQDHIYMVEKIISEYEIFVQSRRILEEIEQHSELTKAGIAKAYRSMKEFEGGYSPTEEKETKKAEAISLYEDLMKKADEKSKMREKIAQDIANAISSPKFNSSDDRERIDFEKLEGEQENNG